MGNCKLNWATIFQKFLPFGKPMSIKEKGNKSQPKRRACSVFIYHFTKVFSNFKVSYHLLCENYQDKRIFYWITQVSVWLRSPASVGNYSAQMQRVVRVGFSPTNFPEKCRAKRIVFLCSWNLDCRDDRLIILDLWSKHLLIKHAVESNVVLE